MFKAMQGYWTKNGWTLGNLEKAEAVLPTGVIRKGWIDEKGNVYVKVKHLNNTKIPQAFNGTNVEEVLNEGAIVDKWQCVNIELLKEVIE